MAIRSSSAPQAGLMALLAQGIVGGDMPWPLVVTGMVFGIALIMLQVRSPMLVSVGMYLPLQTSFAIFIGGLLRWGSDVVAKRRGYNEAQKARIESVGILIASGLIAGEALTGLVVAYFKFKDQPMPEFFPDPSYVFGLGVMALLGIAMIVNLRFRKPAGRRIPLRLRRSCDPTSRDPGPGGCSRSVAVAVRYGPLQLRRQLDRSLLHRTRLAPPRFAAAEITLHVSWIVWAMTARCITSSRTIPG